MIPKGLAAKIEKKKIPISTSIELTWKCNLRCQHCYQYPPTTNELTKYEIKDIIDQLAQAGCLYLTFTGGEPLLRNDFWEIAEYARKKTFAVTLYTNATLLTEPMADRIADLKFLQVHISILGSTASTHDDITGRKGSFYKAIDVIKALRKRHVTVLMKTTVLKSNLSDIEQISELANNLNVETVVSPVVFPTNQGSNKPVLLRLDDEELRKLLTISLKLRKETAPPKKSLYCNLGRWDCCINPIGQVYPCVSFPCVIGDLRKNSFQEIWLSSPSQFLEKLRAIKIEELKECFKCNLSPTCQRCIGLAYAEDSDMLGCSTECRRITYVRREVLLHEEKV